MIVIVKSVISVIMIGMSVSVSVSALNVIINVTKIVISAPSVIMIGTMTLATPATPATPATLVTLVTVD
ncbi:hypothetical protein [Pelosinus sp. IPA-1]|uniref:hypothetical protein n=1 Tax=Pelosinus sp. IPA-1 TaxID=3029569 RepID=UPI0025555B11|nr:hypothetical protein [Pelosinus sp. IPA-1]